MLRVGAVEALAHRSQPVRRLLDLGATWSKDVREDVAYVPTPYRTAHQLSSADVDKLVCAWKAGTGVIKLAAQFGIHRHTVLRQLQARGIDTTQKLTPEELAEAARLYREGWSLARLAERYGISDCTVRTRLIEVDVVMRPRKGGKQKAA